MCSSARRSLLLAFFIAITLGSTQAVTKGGSSGGGGGSRSTGSGASATSGGGGTRTYGKSIGTQNRLRIVLGAVIAAAWFHAAFYPSIRINYDGYYDECALRNITASQLGLNDSAIDTTAVDTELPGILSAYNSNSQQDIYALNQSLFTTTNGLIVDPDYCNYTAIDPNGGAAVALRAPGWGMVAVGVATVTALALASGTRRG